MIRSLHCAFLEATCSNPACKVGWCVAEKEFAAGTTYGEAAPATLRKLSRDEAREVRIVAISVLKDRRIKPSKEAVAKVMTIPSIRELGIRRAGELKNWPLKD